MAGQPNGVVLVTGPTDSGRTTMLYTTLKQLAADEVNACAVEGPIGVIEPSFNQMRVQHSIDLVFASDVRTLLRRDPDIIMVGEVRDLETAEMAIQAALTGHLVLSTLHTNDSPTAITHLLEPDVSYYLIRATVLRVMAQCLMRMLCPYCKAPIQLMDNNWHEPTRPWSAPPPSGTHQAVSCLEYRDTGYYGYAGVYGVILFSDSLKELTTADTDLVALRRQVYKEGTRSLCLSGAQKVATSISTLEGVLRMTPQSEQK